MFHFFKHGMVNLRDIFQVLQESTGYYFTTQFTDNGNVMLMKPRVAVDALSYEQPWVVRFEVMEDAYLRLNIVTPLQLDADGSLYNRHVGSLNTEDSPRELGYWHRRRGLTGGAKYNRPFSILFCADTHGFAFAIWEHAVVNDVDRQLSWVVVQKPVDWETGIVIPTEHNPVMALSGVFNRYHANIQQMLVRESDIPVPAPAITAIHNQYTRESVMHTVKLKEIAENRDYIIQYPNNFSTERFSYDGVFDLIGFANTDLVSANANLTMDVFNSRRTYHSMVSTEADNAGISVMFRTA